MRHARTKGPKLLGIWRRRPDLNRGWRFCRPLPYLLATAPLKMARGPMKARVVCENGRPPSLARSTRELRWAPFACIPERRVACHPKLSSCVEQPTVARTDLLASYGGHPSRAFQSEGWPATRSSRVASNSPPSLARSTRELWWAPFACIPERRVERETGFEPAT